MTIRFLTIFKLAIVCFSFCSIFGCATRAEFVPARTGVAYKIDNFVNIREVMVSSESGDVLWQTVANRGDSRFTEVNYGVPPGAMKEVVAAKPLKVGEKVVWSVTYGYHGNFSSQIRWITETFDVTGENQFRRSDLGRK
jgi:hypothetical protein